MDDGFFMWPGFMAFMLDGMIEANPDAKDLVVHIDSPGGDIIEGYRIYNRLMDFRAAGGTVRVIVEGMAASMATAIVQAATPGMREARKASTWMMHKPLFSGISWANANDLRKMATTLDSFEQTLTAIYVKGSGLTAEQVNAHLEEEQFISPEQAVERGYLDKVLEEAPAVPVKQREAKAVAFYNPKNINQPENNTMAETKKPSKWETFVALAKNLFEESPENTAEEGATAPAAASEALEDGSELFFEGELAEGTAVFTDAELTTPAADGDHKLASGKTITVAEGKVTAIADSVVEESAEAVALRDAQAEIQNLKDQLTAAQALSTEVTNLKAQITALKKAVPGGGDKTPAPVQNFKGDNTAEPEKLAKEKNAFKALAKR